MDGNSSATTQPQTSTNTANTAVIAVTAPFLRLPAELRIRVYEEAVVSGVTLFRLAEPALMLVSKQLRNEVGDVFYGSNIFKFHRHSFYEGTLNAQSLRQLRRRAGDHAIGAVMVVRDVCYDGPGDIKRMWLSFRVQLSEKGTVEIHTGSDSAQKLVIMDERVTLNWNPTRELCLCGLARMALRVVPGRQAVLDFMDQYLAYVYTDPKDNKLFVCRTCQAGRSRRLKLRL
ncbi:unnamed protein product [Zymoseptoria tritici ST99CH_1E4]|uniref:F-box domain-containing protein n=1 Tax=Zymoseptoria tritici ST99CH_1E4 TaxID=1276532 RepID=A0A2H1FPL1_ZYMTR|nr:unnamed protein product [Zymoseptoria tritici ST99CH_1E4]